MAFPGGAALSPYATTKQHPQPRPQPHMQLAVIALIAKLVTWTKVLYTYTMIVLHFFCRL